MPAYIIAQGDITDPAQYRTYLKAVPPVIEKYGRTAIARSPAPVTREGPEEKRRIVILRFPTVEKARECYDSPEYRKARELRRGAAVGELVVVEGSAVTD